MTHPDSSTLRRFADGELPGSAHESVQFHVTQCEGCRVMVGELKREDEWIASLLSTLDSPTPRLRIEAGRIGSHAWLRRAAALLFATSLAGAAWALPGSPLRSWLDPDGDEIGDGVSPAPPSASSQTRAGIDIDAGGPIVIGFQGPQTEGVLRVSLADLGVLSLVVLDDDARLDTPSDGVVNVDNTGSSASYEIRVPRDARDVTIRMGTRILFRKRSDAITAPGAAETDGVYIIRLDASVSAEAADRARQ